MLQADGGSDEEFRVVIDARPDSTTSAAALRPAVVGCLVALLALFGWWQQVPELTSWGGTATTSVLTAVLLAGAGVACVLRLAEDRRRLVVALTLLGVVAWVAPGPVTDGVQALLPGASVLPSPGTLLATGLLLAAALVPPGRQGAPDVLLAASAVAVAAVSLSGLVLGDDRLVAAGAGDVGSGLALPTAALVVAAAAAVWLRTPDRDTSAGPLPLVGIALAPLLATAAAASDRDLYVVLVAVLVGVGMLTALQQLQQARRAADALTGAVLRATPTATLLVRRDGTIAFVNEAAGELFGWSAEELVGHQIDRLVPPDVRHTHAAHRDAYTSGLGGGEARQMQNGDISAVRADGSTFRADVWLSPVDVLGEEMVVASVADVTQVVDHISALEDLHALQSLVMTTVTHDLRSPLTVIRGMAQLLAMPGGVPDDDRDDLAQRIVANATKLDELISDLLDLEQVRRHGVEAATVSSLELAAEHARSTGDQLGLELTITSTDGLPSVLAEPAMLRRIVDNLLGNAAKYAPGLVEVDFQLADDGVWLLVEDHGEGVPPELRQKVFRAFERGIGDRTGIRGNGIGLSLVSEFASRVGGQAVVTDRQDGAPGASFRVRLPAAASPTRVDATP